MPPDLVRLYACYALIATATSVPYLEALEVQHQDARQAPQHMADDVEAARRTAAIAVLRDRLLLRQRE